MKIETVTSQGCNVRVKQYEDSETLNMVKDPVKLRAITDGINKYLRQKSALVDFRFDLVTALVTLTGVAMKTKTATVDGKQVTVPDETEGEYLSRAKTEAVKNASSPFALKLRVTGSDPKAREASYKAALQALADKCGDIDTAGNPIARNDDGVLTAPGYAYLLDITRPPRQPGKAKTPPKYAIEGATNIINNHSEAKWAKRWTEGYTNAQGVVIDPITFQPFDTKPAKGATPEEVEKVRQQNITNLAWAVAEDRNQVIAKTVQKDYA